MDNQEYLIQCARQYIKDLIHDSNVTLEERVDALLIDLEIWPDPFIPAGWPAWDGIEKEERQKRIEILKTEILAWRDKIIETTLLHFSQKLIEAEFPDIFDTKISKINAEFPDFLDRMSEGIYPNEILSVADVHANRIIEAKVIGYTLGFPDSGIEDVRIQYDKKKYARYLLTREEIETELQNLSEATEEEMESGKIAMVFDSSEERDQQLSYHYSIMDNPDLHTDCKNNPEKYRISWGAGDYIIWECI